ncbi:Hypothetical protein R9X50_00763800 [Acrodontium crateriforme]|uniref:HORMA domain-containing protein n=1 Tax=Acrodontium crateriforme TaxID=150365 RepID=A0AAQ3MC39_9PEZI|nr:Hypothetical protein R9X50_00763800 [Acrodontium crateriforme]
MGDNLPTFRTLVTTFTDFFTVAIHSILYERSIYPKTSFLSARKYNFAVRQNRHPKVCEWINDAVSAVETELLKGSIDRVVVLIYTKSNLPRERFVFDLSRFPVVPASEADTLLRQPGANGEESILPIFDIEEQFRATMSKIANCSTTLKPLPEGCTFTVAIELKAQGQAPVGHPQPWIPTESPREAAPNEEGNARTIPLRRIAAGSVVFESWIEECAENDS